MCPTYSLVSFHLLLNQILISKYEGFPILCTKGMKGKLSILQKKQISRENLKGSGSNVWAFNLFFPHVRIHEEIIIRNGSM